MKGRTTPKIENLFVQSQSLRILLLMIPALFYSLGIAKATEAPTQPRNKRVIIVAKSGTSNYSSIQTALNNARPGDTIQVKDGTYNGRLVFKISGTKSEPITLMNYPGHEPVIRPGGSKSLSSVSKSEKIDIKASWIILEGFEITNGWDGVKVYNPHVTIRNNYIHHNHNQGIFTSAGHILIEDNISEWNGVTTCTISSTPEGEISPRHCHGMYLNDNGSQSVSDITIRGNTVENHGGYGILFKGPGHKNHLVENNLLRNNGLGGIGSNVYNSKFLNNEVL